MSAVNHSTDGSKESVCVCNNCIIVHYVPLVFGADISKLDLQIRHKNELLERVSTAH